MPKGWITSGYLRNTHSGCYGWKPVRGHTLALKIFVIKELVRQILTLNGWITLPVLSNGIEKRSHISFMVGVLKNLCLPLYSLKMRT